MPSVEKADRVSRSDWLEAGLAALAKGGVIFRAAARLADK